MRSKQHANQAQPPSATLLRYVETRLKADAEFHRLLAELAVRATANRDLPVLLPQICRDVSVLFAIPLVLISRFEPPDTLVVVASTQQEVNLPVRISIYEPAFYCGMAVRERRAICRNQLDEQLSPTLLSVVDHAVESVLAAPIMANDIVLGTIGLGSDERGRFGKNDLVRITQLAHIIGGVLANAQAYERERQFADRLKALERWRTSFLHVMAHELRTPLGQVLGFMELLEDESTSLSPRGQRYLANARTAGANLDGVVKRALDVLDLFGSDARLSLQPLSLPDLLEAVLAPYRATLAQKCVSVDVSAVRRAALVHGDGTRLRQALDILIGNAAKFVQVDGTITIALDVEPSRTHLTVWNSGTGVPPELADQIFTHGVTENSLTRLHGGAGLSLLLARRIAELHNGSLVLAPSDVGACFVLTLPDAPAM
jgi:signal transduction histidine kinase